MTSGPLRFASCPLRVHVPVATWYTPAWRNGDVIGFTRESRLFCAEAFEPRNAARATENQTPRKGARAPILAHDGVNEPTGAAPLRWN